jgi:hypothetical protein
MSNRLKYLRNQYRIIQLITHGAEISLVADQPPKTVSLYHAGNWYRCPRPQVHEIYKKLLGDGWLQVQDRTVGYKSFQMVNPLFVGA